MEKRSYGYLIILVLFISGPVSTHAQSHAAIKIYQNTDIFETEYYESGNDRLTQFENVNFSRISVAVSIPAKTGNIHEIEVFIPEISKSLDDLQFPMNYRFRKDISLDGNADAYSFRYEFSKILTDESKRFSVRVGAGVNPYYVAIEYVPNDPGSYYRATKVYGFATNITPGIKYALGERMSVDLNVPLKVYDMRMEYNRVSNPAIPIRQQKSNDQRHIFFESAYTIRFGLAYDLSK
jgi:hypothetical protein